MFISDQRFILKTCGKTELLKIVDKIMLLAKTYTQLNNVTKVYYSRKNFLRPNLQPPIHRCFEEEVEILNKYFPGKKLPFRKTLS